MEFLPKILSVAIGGAFGATARYLINISPLQNAFGKFPFPTFFINILGSFLIGFFLIILTEKMTVSETFKLLILVGFLGAFTTFSTLELEIWVLIEESQYLTAFTYLFLSVLLGFIGVVAGNLLAEKF
jgi:CrcB protein